MKFVTYNIQYSKGKDGSFELERIANVVADADVIAMQEVTRGFPGAPDVDQPARIAEYLNDRYWIYGSPVDVDGSQRLEDGRVLNQRIQFGNLIVSRYPIISSRLWLLPRQRTYVQTNFQGGALEAVIALPSGPIRVYCVHLNHAHHLERLAQLEYLLPHMFNVPSTGGVLTGSESPWIPETPMPEHFVMMGDCNFKPDSKEYERVVGEADYFYGRRIDSEHLVDAWAQAGHNEADGITWYNEQANFKEGSRLDYCFVSPGLASSVSEAWIDHDAIGSDHQPTWCDIRLD